MTANPNNVHANCPEDEKHTPKLHADSHVSGADSIPDATPETRGLMSATQAQALLDASSGGASEINISLLTEKTVLENADSMLLDSGDSGTPRKALLSSLWAWINSKLSTVATSGSYNDLTDKPTGGIDINSLDAIDSFDDADALATYDDSGTANKKGTLAQLWTWIRSHVATDFLAKDNTASFTPTTDYHPATKKYVDDNAGGESRWLEIDSSRYTATPASTSRITISDTTGLVAGLPLKYVYNGVTYYGIISIVVINSYIDIAGAALNTGQDLTALYVGKPEMATQADFCISGAFADAADTALLANDMNTFFKWGGSAARIVQVSYSVGTEDTGMANPRINVRADGFDVITSAVEVSDTVQQTVVNINTANYDLVYSDSIEITTDANGSNDDAEDLTISCVIVYI